ncbi:MAG: PadR family transcriptional regulator [Patescibacteria group bacterium]|nr:PadR family transcriptional regulator [Patescibacteria group bacterium]
MNPFLTSEDVPVLSQQEMAILVVLADGQRTGYEIVRQCDFDSGHERGISNGTLYPALKKMGKAGLVCGEEPSTPRPGGRARIYWLTDLGCMLLGWQLDSYARLVDLGRDRLRVRELHNKKPA